MWNWVIDASEPLVREAIGALVILVTLAFLVMRAPRRWELGLALSIVGLLTLLCSFLLGASAGVSGQQGGPRPPYMPVVTVLRYYAGLPLLLVGLVLQTSFTRRLLVAARIVLADSRREMASVDPATGEDGGDARPDGSVADRVNARLRRTVKLLGRSEERFRRVFEQANDSFVVAEIGSGQIVRANRRMAELTGFGLAELEGMDLKEIYGREVKVHDGRELRRLARKRGLTPLPVLKKDGSEIKVEVSFSVLEEGGKSFLLCIARDVSERERLLLALESKNLTLEEREGKLREANFELAQRAEKVREMNERLRQLQAEKDAIFSSVSHELRTPLTSIRSFSEILLEYEDTEESVKREFIGVIHRESERLSRLVNDVLDLAKIEAGAIQFRMTVVDLAELAAEVVRSMAPLAEAREVTIETDLPPGLPLAEGDRDRLQQVLTNLLSNAIKFGARGEAVKLRGRSADDGTIEISVQDEGPGIPEEDLERVFDRFRRADSGEGGGTGLGLAICREIIALHGGRIWGRSRVGRGTTFSFTVRACRSPRGAATGSRSRGSL